jgi:hypothetical protein
MRSTVVLMSAAALLLTAPALAQGKPPSAATEAQAGARFLAEEALAYFKDGRWAEAYVAFSEANRLFHAPSLVSYMGLCRRNQAKLVEARALFESVLAEPIPRDAPDAFKKAVETARVEVEKLRGRIPLLRVKVVGPGAEQARVTVDGVLLTPAERGEGKAVDPGEHQITAEAGGPASSAKATLKEGDTPTVELRVAAAPGPAAGAAAEPGPARPGERRPGSMLPAGIALGVGGAGLVVGTVTGLLALSKISAAQAGCTAPDAGGVRHCPAGNASAASAASGLRVGAGVGFALAGAGVVTGVVLAVVRPGGAAPEAKVGVGVEVGPGWLGLRGRF